jgi:hypothetical protein
MLRADQVAARDDALGQIAAAMHAAPLGGKIPLAVAADHQIERAARPVHGHADHVVGPDVADSRHRAPGFAHTASYPRGGQEVP